jgi:hypothetical protein
MLFDNYGSVDAPLTLEQVLFHAVEFRASGDLAHEMHFEFVIS